MVSFFSVKDEHLSGHGCFCVQVAMCVFSTDDPPLSHTDVLGWVQGAKTALGTRGNQGWMDSRDGFMGKIGGKSAVVPASGAGTI